MRLRFRKIFGAIVRRYNHFKTDLQVRYWNFTIRLPNLLLALPAIGAVLVLALGVYLFFKWFPFAYPDQSMTLQVLMPGFYANCITTILGTGFTVLFFDILTRLRDNRLEQVRLIRDIGCGDHGIAIRAIVELINNDLHRNKLFRKSILRNRIFSQVSLSLVELLNADISQASFHDSDFTGARFENAKLEHTTFWNCRLYHAFFNDADTTNADFVYSDLTKARITRAQLRSAWRLHGARLPDGKIYDGSFNLPGDIADAKAYGIDIMDPTAMAEFYAMTQGQLNTRWFSHGDGLGPEYTDWGNQWGN